MSSNSLLPTLESVEYQRHDAKSEAWPTGDRQPDDVELRESRANTLKKRRTCECPYAHALPAITTSEALELARRAPGLRCGLIYGYNDGNSKFRSNINDRQ